MPAGQAVTCCISGCERNKPPATPVAKWICPDHWSRVDHELRRAFNRIVQAWEKDPSGQHDALMEAWNDCEQQANERAA